MESTYRVLASAFALILPLEEPVLFNEFIFIKMLFKIYYIMWICQLGGAGGELGRLLVVDVAEFAFTLLLDIEEVKSKICINHDNLALL